MTEETSANEVDMNTSENQESKEIERWEVQPAIIERSGGRERKQIEVFNASAPDREDKKQYIIGKGQGIRLGDYKYFCDCLDLNRGDSDIIKSLHMLIYGTPGKKQDSKKNLRNFNGYPDLNNKENRLKKLIENKKKWVLSLLKEALNLFGLPVTGTREELAVKLNDYLHNPEIIKKEGEKKEKISKDSSSKKRKNPSSKSSSSKQVKEKKKKIPRPESAYNIFLRLNRSIVKENNPTASFGELSSLIGAQWKALEVQEKNVYIEKAAIAKIEFIANGGLEESKTEEDVVEDEQDDYDDIFDQDTDDEKIEGDEEL